jgi:tetratricopeptide (TPR) repeat protein
MAAEESNKPEKETVVKKPLEKAGEAKEVSIPPKKPMATEESKKPKKETVVKKSLEIEDQVVNYRELGIELYKNKEYADAITEFNKVLSVRPNDSLAREYLAKSHFQQGLVLFGKEDYLGARDEFEASLKYDKKCDKCDENIRKSEDTFKEVHYNKGLAYFGEQRLTDAIKEWEPVYELDPNYKDVNKNLTKAKNLNERLESIKRSKAMENKQ